MDLLKVRARSVVDMVDQAAPFLVDEVAEYEERTVAKQWAKDPQGVHARLGALHERLEHALWSEEALEAILRGLAEELEVGAGKLIHPLRLAVTGRGNSPGIFEVLVLLGRAKTLKRLVLAREHLSRMPERSA